MKNIKNFNDRSFKIISAVVFQYLILLVLSACLFTGVGDQQIILGGFIGMLVGVGTESISTIPSREQGRDEI